MKRVEFNGLSILCIVIACGIPATTSVAQYVSPPDRNTSSESIGEDASATINGKWIYRSFHSTPALSDPEQPLRSLLFGQGELDLKIDSAGLLTGTLGGPGWQLQLRGERQEGEPTSIRFQGRGNIGGEEWVYDYLGYLVPKWPNGKDQREAIVGTIVRTVDHGAAEAGHVAQWIAVKQNAEVPDGPSAEMVNMASAKPQAFEGKTLQAVEKDWAAAVATNDPKIIGRFFPGKFIFVGPSGIMQNRVEHLEDFNSGRLKVESVTVLETTISEHDGFAVVSALADVKGKFGDRDITGSYRFMDTFQKHSDRWIAVSRQQTRVLAPDTISASSKTRNGDLIRHNPDSIHPPFGDLYSHGVEIPGGARVLYIAGQAGVSKDGDVPSNPDAQLELAWANIKAVLNSADMTVDDLVKVTCFIKDAKYTDAYAASVQRHLGTKKTAMTAPIVRQLWSSNWFYEIDAVAAQPVNEPDADDGSVP